MMWRDYMMWSNYIAEREGTSVYESSHGFFSYRMQGSDFYVRDFYVMPQFRGFGTKALYEKIQSIAKELGAERITTAVMVEAHTAQRALMVNLRHGFKPVRSENNVIFLAKEL